MHRKILNGLIIVIAAVSVSCNKDFIPPVDGYYVLDGVQYPVHLATINASSYTFSGQTSFNPSATFMGASGHYVDIEVITTAKTIAPGTYPFDYFINNNPLRLSYFSVTNGVTNRYTPNAQSTGSLTVAVSGGVYTFDFSGKLDGHDLKFHYAGKVDIHTY